jgi:hypothetical protein
MLLIVLCLGYVSRPSFATHGVDTWSVCFVVWKMVPDDLKTHAVDIFMSYVFFWSVGNICPDDIKIHSWGNILAWNHVNVLFLSKMFPDNVATHHVSTKKNQPFHSDRRWTHDMPNPACSLQQTM